MFATSKVQITIMLLVYIVNYKQKFAFCLDHLTKTYMYGHLYSGKKSSS